MTCISPCIKPILISSFPDAFPVSMTFSSFLYFVIGLFLIVTFISVSSCCSNSVSRYNSPTLLMV